MTRRSFETAMKKGAVGESIVRGKLEGAGWIVYQPATDGAHAFDMLGVKDKQKAIALDVKAKSLMNKYPATGVDQQHFEQYQQFSERHAMPFWLFFVDEHLGEIYGNSLEVLEKPVVVDGHLYPKVLTVANSKQIRIWPYVVMKKIAMLSNGDIQALMEYSQRNYEYDVNISPVGA